MRREMEIKAIPPPVVIRFGICSMCVALLACASNTPSRVRFVELIESYIGYQIERLPPSSSIRWQDLKETGDLKNGNEIRRYRFITNVNAEPCQYFLEIDRYSRRIVKAYIDPEANQGCYVR